MRLTALRQRASELRAEIARMTEAEQACRSKPNPTLSDLSAHRERQERFGQIVAELARLAEETAD